MRLKRISAPCFGMLSDRTFDFGDSVTVVLGPNEAGKTTFHSAIETLLYGFSPASREQHPLTQWNEDVTLHLEGEFAPDRGDPFAVERRLKSAATLRVGRPGDLSDAKLERSNTALRQVSSIPRELYHSVYSLEAGAALKYRDSVKEHIDELLLGETGLDAARPLHEVRVKLDAEHKALWRSDGRSKPRARLLNQEIKDAGRAWKDARTARDERRQGEVELAAQRASREKMVARRDELRRAHEDAKFARSRAELIDRRARLQVQDPEWLEQAPQRDPASIAADLDTLNAKLSKPRVRLALEALEIVGADEQLADRGAELTPCIERRVLRESAEARIADLKQETREALGDAAGVLSSLGAKPNMAALQALPMNALKEEAKRWRDAGSQVAPSRPGVVIGLAVVGLLMALAAAIPGAPSDLVVGSLLIIPALVRLLKPEQQTVVTRRDEVLTALGPLGLEPRDAAELDNMLRELDGAQRSLTIAGRSEDRERGLQEQFDSSEAQDRALIATFGIEPLGEISTLVDQVQRRIERAQTNLEARAADHTEREQAGAVLSANADALEALTAEFEAAQTFLRTGWSDHPELADAWSAWKLELAERHQVDALEQGLRADPRFETIEPLREAVQDFEGEQAELDESIEAAIAEITRLQHLVDSTPDEVTLRHEELLALEQELGDVRRERDHLMLLDTILVDAEAVHREAHQPEVLNSASQYLLTITNGRYSGLDYVEGPKGDLSVKLQETGDRFIVGDSLSRGTQEQIYVCLRLGTLDYLDHDRETLPLVFDEALVHWDGPRRAALYPLLAEIASKRQVVLFTCHEWLADEARAAIGASVIDLTNEVADPREDAEPIVEIPASSSIETTDQAPATPSSSDESESAPTLFE
jgi:uncharacterized protein YhaN